MQDHDFMDLNLHTYITAKRKSISARIFRVLLDDFRTEDQPVSALTGLRFPSSFGRPDLSGIFSKFDEEMRQEQWAGDVGVFFCGHPAMARELADGCSMLTAKARNEGRLLKYTFMNEVFG
jgi:dual oxidase